MQTKTTSDPLSLQFQFLPQFAGYLLQNHLQEYAACQVRYGRQLQIPLLKVLDKMPEEQLMPFIEAQSHEFLTHLVENNARNLIDEAVKKWIENQLPLIDQQDIAAEDITLVSLLRKRTFLHFIPGYTTDAEEMIELIKEIDTIITVFETASSNTFINLLQSRINEHSHFIQQINHTTPGAIYVFDLEHFKGIYSNGKLKEVLGYDHDDLNRLGPSVFQNLIHPDDQLSVRKKAAYLRSLPDGEIHTYKFRIKKDDTDYRWVRLYESVFKRDAGGQVTQAIGIALDIDNEKRVADQLHQREQQLLEAQDIAQLGSFTWHFEERRLEGTPKLFELLNLKQDSAETFYQNIHPDDLETLKTCFKDALKSGNMDCEYRYQQGEEEKVLWSKAKITFKDGEPDTMTGTIMDVTERHHIMENLRKSEKSYKQAESLAHIGNYKVDIRTNAIQMSDELYRIYGLDPAKKIVDYSFVTKMRHPEDSTLVAEELQKAILEKRPYDFYFRIYTGTGALKIVRARGEAVVDEEGKPTHYLGTIQDVTEKQQLLQKLRESDYMYKQAEALANMGNFSMNVKTGEIEWTDQLFVIYGLEPQSEKITEERFYTFIHPDDRAYVDAAIEAFYKSGNADYTFRIITTAGDIKTLRSIAQLHRDEVGQPQLVIGTEQDITEHKQLISKLEKSEWLNKQAQAIARLGNWSFDVQTRNTIWSDELYRIYEVPPGEKISFEMFVSFIHPDDKEDVLDYYQKCLANKTPYNKIHRIVLRDGTVKIVHRKGQLRLDAEGNVVEVFGTTQDITEQQAHENELREKQNFIQKIADATPSIIASYNINTGQYTFINEGLRKLLGYDPQDVFDKGAAFVASLIPPDDVAEVMEKNKTVAEEANLPENQKKDNIIVEFIYRMRHKDGTYHWFQTYGTIFDRNEQGLIEHVLNISLDISQQVEATQKIKDQEHFIRHIADASPTILYLYNVDENSFAYINREIYYVLGYTADEIIQAGDTITNLIYHPEDYNLLPERRESNRHFSHTDAMIQYECRMKNKAGDWCWLLVREVMFKSDEEGHVVQILGAALDITKRKEMEKALLQNAFQLEQSNSSLEEFAYVASHDLKEPLRKISTFGDRLLHTQIEQLTEDGKVYLKKIVEASQRMQVMINDLLSISMITGDRAFEPFSLQAILDEVLQTLEYKIEQKSAQIQADDLPIAHIIPSQFRQLFQNLLSNSLKFVRDDRQPLITITHQFFEPHDVAHLQITKAPKYLQLQFKDNGIGFEEEYAGKIFAIFQRLHGRSEYEGTGIGLAICKKIVEHHGGVIFAAGKEGIGATFTIILPA